MEIRGFVRPPIIGCATDQRTCHSVHSGRAVQWITLPPYQPRPVRHHSRMNSPSRRDQAAHQMLRMNQIAPSQTARNVMTVQHTPSQLTEYTVEPGT